MTPHPIRDETPSEKARVRAEIAAALPAAWREPGQAPGQAPRPASVRSAGDVRAELKEIGTVRNLMRKLRLPGR